jgi:hypothetical protein
MPRLAPDQRAARDRRIRARLQRGDRPADIARADIASDEHCDTALVYEKRNERLGRGSAFRKKLQRLINRMPPEERAHIQL